MVRNKKQNSEPNCFIKIFQIAHRVLHFPFWTHFEWFLYVGSLTIGFHLICLRRTRIIDRMISSIILLVKNFNRMIRHCIMPTLVQNNYFQIAMCTKVEFVMSTNFIQMKRVNNFVFWKISDESSTSPGLNCRATEKSRVCAYSALLLKFIRKINLDSKD